MQSILILVYVLIPHTFGVRNYQSSMIGMYNSGVPKVPNSQHIYELHANSKKKGRQVLFQKVNEEEPPPEPSAENPDRGPQASYFDLRRQNSAKTERPQIPLDFPIPGGQVGGYNPYSTILRQGPSDDGGVNIDSAPSSESFGQYFPVPPFPQGRGENENSIQERGENENDVQPSELYAPSIEKAVPEEYNEEKGGTNGNKRGSNGLNGETDDFKHDMDTFQNIIKDMTPPEKTYPSPAQNPEQQDLVDTYKRITNTLNGNVIDKEPLGYIGGSNGVQEVVSVGYNGGSNGFNVESNGFNGESNGFNGESNGFNVDSNGFMGSKEAKKVARQGYNIQFTGIKVTNKGNDGGYNGRNQENIKYDNDILAYNKRIKALPAPEKSWAWTSKSLNLNPEQREIVQKYKRILDMLNGKIL